MPHLDRAAAIATALGLELTIGPPRPAAATPPPASGDGDESGGGAAPADAGVERVSDRRLAEILASLADEWEALNEAGRASMATRFWHDHPHLRERAVARAGRRLAWLAGDRGAR